MTTKNPDSKNIFLEPANPPVGLFDKIILAIKQEKEFKQTGNLLFLFIFLLAVSLIALPFSWLFFLHRWENSGIYYFIFSALTNIGIFFRIWQDFVLSILELVPAVSLALFATNIALIFFCIRLFLYRKGVLLKYLKHSFV